MNHKYDKDDHVRTEFVKKRHGKGQGREKKAYQEVGAVMTNEYISLCSSDGFQFVVPFEMMRLSRTIYNMIKGTGEFKEIKSVIHVPIRTPEISPLHQLSKDTKISADENQN